MHVAKHGKQSCWSIKVFLSYYSLVKALVEHITLMYRDEGMGIIDELPNNLTETLRVSHAYKAWCYIWTRLTTPVMWG